MARLASIAKAGYYPLPPALLPAVAAAIELDWSNASGARGYDRTKHAVLDPCAGEGEALFHLAKEWDHQDLAVYGCELEATRYAKLRARARAFKHHLNGVHLQKGDAFSLAATTNESCPGVSVLYLNPPYDTDKEHGRLEERWLAHFSKLLRPGGVLVFVVPYYALAASACTLGRLYTEIQVCQFPAEHFATFKQVILFARRRDADLLFADAQVEAAVLRNAESIESLTPLAEVKSYKVSAKKMHSIFSGHFDTQAVDPAEVTRAFKPWHTTVKGELLPISKVLPSGLWLDLSLRTYPLACPPRASYIAAGIASGVFNGCRIEPDDPSSGLPPLYLKGTFTREYHTVDEQKNDKGELTKQVQVQHPVLTITVLNALTCAKYINLASSVDVNPTETDIEKFTVGDLFSRYSRSLMRVLRERCPILHDPSNPAHTMPLPSFPRTLFKAQENAVRTAVKLLRGPDRAAMILGQIGSGKSTVATATAQAVGAKCVLILCPPHLLTSWTDQCSYVIPWAKVHVLEKPADLQALADDTTDGMKVAIMSREAAKLGHSYASVYEEQYNALAKEYETLTEGDHATRRALDKRWDALWRCPECRRPIDKKWTPEFITTKRKRCEAHLLRFVNAEARLVRRLAWALATVYPGSALIGQLLDAPAINAVRASKATHEDLKASLPGNSVAAVARELVDVMTAHAHNVALGWSDGHPHSLALYHLCAYLARDASWHPFIIEMAQRLIPLGSRYGKRKDGSKYKPEDVDWERRPTGLSDVGSIMWRLISLLPPAEIESFIAWADNGASAIAEPPDLSIDDFPGHNHRALWEAELVQKAAYDAAVGALRRAQPPSDDMGTALDMLVKGQHEKTEKVWRHPFDSISVKAPCPEAASDGERREPHTDLARLTSLGLPTNALVFNGAALGDPCHVLTALKALHKVAVIKTDHKCGAALYQAVPRPRRYPLAKLIVRRYSSLFDFLILDEGHEYSNESSAQSQAAQRLIGLKLPTVLLTGSVMNGYASSLFVPCWSLSTRFRDEFGRDGVTEYVERYGYQKRTITYAGNKADVSYGKVSDRTEQKKSLAQAPGVMPVSLLRHVLPIAVTLQLEDLEAELPQKEEIVIAVDAPPDVLSRYKVARDRIINAIKRDRFTNKAGKLFGQLSELPSYLDRATSDTGNRLDGSYVVQYPKDVGGEVLASFAGLDPKTLLPKEARLCQTIRKELGEGRRVMVFPWHTELMPRLKRIIEAECRARVVILDAEKVPSKKREKWIDTHVVKAGADVLLVNPVAVQTGLNNLVYFSTVVWYENPGCNPQVRRQAQGRIYRIGQTQPVRMYTLYYADTAQELMHELLLYKVGISEAVDGLDPKGALEAAGVGEVSDLSGQSVGAVLYKMLVKEMGLGD